MYSLVRRYWKNPRLWQLALGCYWLALFIGTHVPIERLALNRGAADKFAHVAAFAGLAAIFATAWQLSAGRLTIRNLTSVWLIIALYGAFEEITQPIVNRNASMWDWFADVTGAALGLAVFWWRPRRWLDKSASPSVVPSNDSRPSKWYRFSLRTLFVAMTVVAVSCYWLMLPTMNAQRFVRAIHQHDYSTANSYFIHRDDRIFEDVQTAEWVGEDPVIHPLTWQDLCAGERHVTLTIRAESSGDRILFLVDRRGVITAFYSSWTH